MEIREFNGEINTIHELEVEEEIIQLRELLKDYTIMSKEAKRLLEQRGYMPYTLGHGKHSKIKSKEIKILNLKTCSTCKPPKGKYLAIGISNPIYQMEYAAFLKKII